MGNVSVPEALWSLTALAGFIFTVFAFRDALIDVRVQRSFEADSRRMLVATSSLRHEAIRVFVQAIFLAVGVFAMLSPPANPSGKVSVISWVVSLGLIGASMAVTLNTFFDRRARVLLLRQERDVIEQELAQADDDAAFR